MKTHFQCKKRSKTCKNVAESRKFAMKDVNTVLDKIQLGFGNNEKCAMEAKNAESDVVRTLPLNSTR